MEKTAARKGAPIYYGWVIVAAACIIWAVAFGVQYSFGMFFKPLQEAFGWSRATTSWAMTIHLTMFALFMLPSGWAIDRFSPRPVYSVAGVLMGAALILSSRISEPWQLYLLYGMPLALAMSICGPTLMAMITRWFTEKRGIALAIAGCGTGFGVLAGAPIANLLISAYGWRQAFVVMGIVSAAVVLACAGLIRRTPRLDDPRVVAQRRPDSAGRISQVTPSVSFKKAIRMKELYLLMVAQSVAAFTLRLVAVHVAPYATDVGITPSTAALAVGAIGFASIAGRLIMGSQQDRLGARRSMMICLGTQSITMLLLPVITTDALFFAYAVIFGFTYGGDVIQMPVMVAETFGVGSIGVILGLVMTVSNLSGAAGPVVAGYVFDATGHYGVVFLLAGALLIAGFLCLWRLKQSR